MQVALVSLCGSLSFQETSLADSVSSLGWHICHLSQGWEPAKPELWRYGKISIFGNQGSALSVVRFLRNTQPPLFLGPGKEGGRMAGWLDGWLDGWMDGWLSCTLVGLRRCQQRCPALSCPRTRPPSALGVRLCFPCHPPFFSAREWGKITDSRHRAS